MEKRNRYTSEFKTKVVLEVLREEQTVNEIAAKYELSPVMVSRWKAEFLDRASMVFDKKTSETDKTAKGIREQARTSREAGWPTHSGGRLAQKKSGLK